ncbi:hypothetical protein KFK09_013320 [Dendrobium nobile]|uniref:Uncharacterized protein n=1 Tax=Dendrobium nobile TaxID=94219 RepID=A0A8T3BCS1_DENNO|nr:hypothetical protein KFK09_013320 [Dendrobium nobile]
MKKKSLNTEPVKEHKKNNEYKTLSLNHRRRRVSGESKKLPWSDGLMVLARRIGKVVDFGEREMSGSEQPAMGWNRL